MKICYISNLYNPLIIGGAEIYVESLVKNLSRMEGVEVFVITTDLPKKNNLTKVSCEMEDGVKIYRFFPVNLYSVYESKQHAFWKKPFAHLINIWNPHSYIVGKQILEREKPDIIHSHNLGGVSISILSAAKKLKIPVVHTLHDYAFLCPHSVLINSKEEVCKKPRMLCKIFRKIMRHLLKDKVQIFLTPSQFLLKYFSEEDFFQSAKSMALPLGFNLEYQKFRKNSTRINILYMGRISKHKGVAVLVKAFKSIEDTNAVLHIAGTGEELEYIKQLAKEDKKIVFHGFVKGVQKRELLSQSHILVAPSTWYETFGITIIEAFEYGCIPVVSDIGAYSELITTGKNGFLLPPNNVEALSKILTDLIRDNKMRETIYDNLSTELHKFDINKHVNDLLKIYNSLL